MLMLFSVLSCILEIFDKKQHSVIKNACKAKRKKWSLNIKDKISEKSWKERNISNTKGGEPEVRVGKMLHSEMVKVVVMLLNAK